MGQLSKGLLAALADGNVIAKRAATILEAQRSELQRLKARHDMAERGLRDMTRELEKCRARVRELESK
jgi:hypothetical protein